MKQEFDRHVQQTSSLVTQLQSQVSDLGQRPAAPSEAEAASKQRPPTTVRTTAAAPVVTAHSTLPHSKPVYPSPSMPGVSHPLRSSAPFDADRQAVIREDDLNGLPGFAQMRRARLNHTLGNDLPQVRAVLAAQRDVQPGDRPHFDQQQRPSFLGDPTHGLKTPAGISSQLGSSANRKLLSATLHPHMDSTMAYPQHQAPAEDLPERVRAWMNPYMHQLDASSAAEAVTHGRDK